MKEPGGPSGRAGHPFLCYDVQMNYDDYSIEPLPRDGAAMMTSPTALISLYGLTATLQMPPAASLPIIEW